MSDLSVQGQQPHQPISSGESTIRARRRTHQALIQDTIAPATMSDKQLRKLIKANPVLVSLMPPNEFLVGDMAKLFESRNKHRAQQAQNDETNSDTFSRLAQALKERGLTATEIRKEFTKINKDEQNFIDDVNDNISNQEAATTDFNDAVSDAQSYIDDYNSARDDYLNAKSDYDSAVTAWNTAQSTFNAAQTLYNSYSSPTPAQTATYNAAVAARNAAQTTYNNAVTAYNNAKNTFNNAIDVYNHYVDHTVEPSVSDYNTARTDFLGTQNSNNNQLTAINIRRSRYGIPAIPNQNQTPTATSSIPNYSHATSSFTPPAAAASPYPITSNLTPLPNADENVLVVTYYDPLVALLNATRDTLETNLNVAQNVDENRRNKLRGKDPFGENTYISKRKHIPAFSVVNAGGGAAIAQYSGMEPGTRLESAISNASTRANELISTQAKLLAADKARAIVGAEAAGTPEGLRALNVIFAVKNAQQVRELIDSGETRKAVENAIIFDPGVDQKTKDAAIDAATATVNQSLIKTAVAELGIALETPGLYGQFLANTEQLKSFDLAKLQDLKLTSQEILNDPQKQLFLKSSLSNQLVNDGRTSRLEAEKIVDQAINFVLQQKGFNDFSDDKIKLSILEAFAKQGVELKQATDLANKAEDILKAQQKAKQALDVTVFNPKILTEELASAGIEKAGKIAEKALSEVANSFAVNNSEFQIALRDELISQGVSLDIANRVVAQVVARGAAVPADNLHTPLVETRSSIPELNSGIYALAMDALKGVEGGKELAKQAVAAIFGSEGTTKPTLLQIFNANDTRDFRLGNTQDQRIETARVRDELTLAFEDRIKLDQHFDLSKLFLYIGLSHIGGPEERSNKKSIDIPI